MKIFTNHRYALITGIVLALVLSYILHRCLAPEQPFIHQSLARWVHIVSGIFWIGLLYYLNAVQVPALGAAAEDKAKAEIEKLDNLDKGRPIVMADEPISNTRSTRYLRNELDRILIRIKDARR